MPNILVFNAKEKMIWLIHLKRLN